MYIYVYLYTMINETKTNGMKTFETGNTYKMRWIGDADLVTEIKVVKRTATRITIRDIDTEELKSCKIRFYQNSEYILPTGQYSMAPVLRATNIG